MNQDIKLVLTAQELDVVARALAEQPYKFVAGVLGKIQHQANDPVLQAGPAGGDPLPSIDTASTPTVQ